MNQISNKTANKAYDLENRTALFAESVIDFIRSVKINDLNRSTISQVIRSSGSIGANYYEAVEGSSRKDFIHKISIARKEAKETCYWLRLLVRTNPDKREHIAPLWKESYQLVLIFSKIVQSSRQNKIAN